MAIFLKLIFDLFFINEFFKCLTISSLNLSPSSLSISSSPKIIAFDSLAPSARFLDLRSSASLIEPKVLALQTSLTKEVDEKSIIDSEGSLL